MIFKREFSRCHLIVFLSIVNWQTSLAPSICRSRSLGTWWIFEDGEEKTRIVSERKRP